MGISKENLKSQVSDFCQTYDFQDKEDVFFRGALAAQNPTTYEDIPDTPLGVHWVSHSQLCSVVLVQLGRLDCMLG